MHMHLGGPLAGSCVVVPVIVPSPRSNLESIVEVVGVLYGYGRMLGLGDMQALRELCLVPLCNKNKYKM